LVATGAGRVISCTDIVSPVDGVLARNNVHVSGRATGQPIVFAHGYGCDLAMWRFVAPAFEPDYRVVSFDHVGFGGSDLSVWTAQRYGTLQAYADDLLEIVRALELREVVFVGHSVAAMIGVLAANAEPDRFAHLILIGPSPRYVDEAVTGYLGGFSASEIDELLETLEGNHLGWSAGMAPVIMGNPDRPDLAQELTASFCRTDPRVASTFARATFLSDNRADLARVTVPTLVLQCAQDAIASEAVGRFVHEHIPGSELVALRATGHCPNLSAPQETVAAIRSYLDSHARASTG
jgi:sigma-B regulation protein RsbQ